MIMPNLSSPGHPARRLTRLTAAAAALALAGSPAAAQASVHGAYEGTITVSGIQHGPEVSYEAVIRIVMPISEAKPTSLVADFLSGEAPNGTVTIRKWEESRTEATADSSGQRASYRCSLAGSVDLPVSVTGVLAVDLRRLMHDFSVTVLTLEDAELDCVHSRSGPYKHRRGFAFTIGTGVPGSQYENPQSFADASRLTAQFTLDPTAYTQGQFGPIVQHWDFRRKR